MRDLRQDGRRRAVGRRYVGNNRHRDRPLEGVRAATSGCYEASRAAALSGVPKSTLYYWARKGIVVPSVSPIQEKLWSYADLIGLRAVAWLRRPKMQGDDEDELLPASPMTRVRGALSLLDRSGVDLWSDFSQSSLLVDQKGGIFVDDGNSMRDVRGNVVLPQEHMFGLTGPIALGDFVGPDLVRPRAHLRIVPDKVAGEPHVEGTRITTKTLAALARRGYQGEAIAEMYMLDPEFVYEAVDLERQLAGIAA
jgi:uncharacterized protein (DUF433 family)